MYAIRSGLILGFHGCDQSILKKVLLGNENLLDSNNKYDWLGYGIYFWDNSPARAFEYASFLKDNPNRAKQPILIPSVIGAVINPGMCLDLLDYTNLQFLRESYEVLESFYKLSGNPIPRNYSTGNNNYLLLKELDCAVIEHLHQMRKQLNLPPFDSVRAAFWEGEQLYPDSSFREKDHIQLCIRNPNCIKGYFLPRKYDDTFNKV